MTSLDNKHWVVIPAAGVGSRMQSNMPKQYLPVAGKPLIVHCIQQFYAAIPNCRFVVALAEHDTYGHALLAELDLPIDICVGGIERADSVRKAVQRVRELDKHNPWVWVHDAARPLISRHDIDAIRHKLDSETVGVLLGQRSVDTLKRVIDGRAATTENRDEIWRALTPQVARAELLLSAYDHAADRQHAVTDEASAVELLGLSLAVIEAENPGIKVTYASDIAWVEQQLSPKIKA